MNVGETLRGSASRPPREQGFTLLEVLVAMGIFIVGATTLIGVLGVGASSRRGTELRARASFWHEELFRRVEDEILPEYPLPDGWESGDDLAIPGIDGEEVDGDLDLNYSVEFTTSPERPALVLVTLRISWLDSGDRSAVVLRRLMTRDAPLLQRVQTRRGDDR